MDLTRAYGPLTAEVARDIDATFDYQPWDTEQEAAGKLVREALAQAFKVIVQHVPAGPDRTTALRELRACRLWCNSAITFRGRL